jgi:type I restriction enzyme S subunit
VKWTTATLGEIAALVDYGLTASATPLPGGPKFLRITDIQNNHVDWDSVPFCQATEREETDNSLAPGDIVFARTGATTGKSFLLRNCPKRAVFASYLIRVRPSDQIDGTYLSKFFQTENYWAQIWKSARGAAQPGVNLTVLKELVVPFPPLDEQRRIAAILDQADGLRRQRRETLRQAEKLEQSLFFSSFGGPRIKDLLWPLVTVGEVGKVQLGRQRAPQYQTGRHTRPYVRVANIFENRIDTSDLLSMDFDEEDFEKYRLNEGDILLNEGQSTELVGRPAMWRSEVANCCFQNTLVRFVADRAKVDPIFSLMVFLAYFRAGEFSKISAKTSSVAHLGSSRFEAMSFPLPPLDLQRSFAARVAEVDKLKAHHHAHLAKLDALFASLQYRAFQGKLFQPTTD